jgi:phosphatidylglycerophosphate synthase
MLNAPLNDRFVLGLLVILLTLPVTLLSVALYYRKVSRQTKDLINAGHYVGGSAILSSAIRGWYYDKIRPFEEFFLKFRISPNALTTTGLVLSIVAAVFFHFGWIGPGGWLVLVSGTFDIFDGAVARKSNKITTSGAFFDSVLDRLGDMFVHIGLLSYYMQPGRTSLPWMFWVVLAGMVSANLVSYSRAKAESSGVKANVGIMQRPERFVFLGFGGIFSSHFHALLAPWIPQNHTIFAGVIIFVTLLSIITVAKRFKFVFRTLKNSESCDDTNNAQ